MRPISPQRSLAVKLLLGALKLFTSPNEANEKKTHFFGEPPNIHHHHHTPDTKVIHQIAKSDLVLR